MNQPPVALGVVHINDYSFVFDLDDLSHRAIFPYHRIGSDASGQRQQLLEELTSYQHWMSAAAEMSGDYDGSAALSENRSDHSHRRR